MRIVLSGGGTGGHIYPALAIAKACKEEVANTELLYICSERGMEKEIVAKQQIPLELIEITGFKRKLSKDNLQTIINFVRGVRRSKRLLKRFQADVVVGTGGYVCGPVLYAAAKLGIPTIIHEQNVIPGLTNRFLSRYVDLVAVSFEGTERHFPKAKCVKYTGNPCASTVVQADREAGWSSLGLPSGAKLVVIVGGSSGARAINEAVWEMMPQLEQMLDTHFVYVTGKAYYDNARQAVEAKSLQLPKNVHMVPYIDNMPEVLAAASLIVNRAGASFLAEITALGLPSVLIPSPNVTNNHQEANARRLADEGAAELLLERNLSGSALLHIIRKIMGNPIVAESMAKKAKQLGEPFAAQQVIQEMMKLCKVQI